MDKFLENIINPPAVKAVGQIWHSNAINEKLLITKALGGGAYRAMVVSPVVEAGDGNDLVLRKSAHSFMASDMVVLRITSGPVWEGDLNLFYGQVGQGLVAESQHLHQYNYDEMQERFIEQIMEKMQPLYMRSTRATEGTSCVE